MRALLFGFLAATLMTTTTYAHPETEDNASPKKVEKLDIEDIKLPTEADIEAIIDKMPDLNQMMGGMLDVMKDEKIQSKLKSAGENFADSVEKSGIKDLTANIDAGELPDFNNLFASLLRLTSDEEVLGDMIGVLSELQSSVEDNFDEDTLKPKKEAP